MGGQPTTEVLTRELVRLLNDLVAMHGELVMLANQKLEAMKRADTNQIASITAREMVLVKRLTEREGLRRQITRKILINLDITDRVKEPVRLAELAEYLQEPRRSELLSVAAGLKKKVQEMEDMRVTTTLVTQEMLKHLRAILSAMTNGDPGMETYGRTGQRQKGGAAHVFEAVG